jgi:hypothetical protein
MPLPREESPSHARRTTASPRLRGSPAARTGRRPPRCGFARKGIMPRPTAVLSHSLRIPRPTRYWFATKNRSVPARALVCGPRRGATQRCRRHLCRPPRVDQRPGRAAYRRSSNMASASLVAPSAASLSATWAVASRTGAVEPEVWRAQIRAQSRRDRIRVITFRDGERAFAARPRTVVDDELCGEFARLEILNRDAARGERAGSRARPLAAQRPREHPVLHALRRSPVPPPGNSLG